MRISAKWIAALLSALVASTLLAAPAQAAPSMEQQFKAAITAALTEAMTQELSPNVTQLVLDILSEEKPEAYEAATAAVEPTDAADLPLSSVPAEVVATIDPEIWDAFVAHEAATQAAVERGTVLTTEEQEAVEEASKGVWSVVWAFVKKYWNAIASKVSAAFGKVKWYRVHLCITGAGAGLYNKYKSDIVSLTAALAGDPVERAQAIYAAAKGCWAYAK